MTATLKYPDKIDRKNKIYVSTTASTDGRGTEGLWMNYDPSNASAVLGILLPILNQSEYVKYYNIFDAEGKRIPFYVNGVIPGYTTKQE